MIRQTAGKLHKVMNEYTDTIRLILNNLEVSYKIRQLKENLFKTFMPTSMQEKTMLIKLLFKHPTEIAGTTFIHHLRS